MRRLVCVLTLIACLSAQAASACSFDGFPIPDSLVDRLLKSNQIVLARPDPHETLRFSITDTLEGAPGASKIPLTLADIERRRLDANPGDAVLFARNGFFGTWQRIGYVTARHRGLFERIADRLPDWRQGVADDRAALFARYVADADPLVRTTALVELGRLPYATLRGLEHGTDTGRILDRLAVLPEHYLIPIRLQLIGLTKDRTVLGTLEARLAEAVQANDPNVLHYATAYVELGGASAVHTLSKAYLSDPGLSLDTRRKVFEAIALHLREGDPRLRVMLQWTLQQAGLSSPELRPARIGSSHGDLRRTFSTPATALPVSDRG